MKYKLLKDIPWFKAWQIFLEDGIVSNINETYKTETWKCLVTKEYAEKYPDFFEPIKEERDIIYPDNLMDWYVIDGHWRVVEALKIGHSREEVIENQYICWTRFPTEDGNQNLIQVT
jgi:hypothetical protein